MTAAVCTVGSTASGICYAHSSITAWTGVVTTSTSGFTIGGLAAASRTSTGLCSCSHHFEIISGSSIFQDINGNGVARVGDPVWVIEDHRGTGTMTSGSSICTSV